MRLRLSRLLNLNLKFISVLLAILGAAELTRGFIALFDPLTLDYSEMIVAGMARQLSKTGSLAAIYAPSTTPYSLPGVQYPPLFIWLTSVLLDLTHLTPLLASRLLAWSGYAGSGIVAGLVVWQELRLRWAALVTVFVPFCFWSVLIFVNAARPDPLALFLSLLAAFLYRRLISTKGPDQISANTISFNPSIPIKFLIGVLLISLICALAFFSKQTYLAIGAAIFFDLILTRNRRLYALLFGALLGMELIVGTLIINSLSENTFLSIFDPIRAARLILDKAPGFVGFFVLDHLPLLVIAILSLIWQVRHKDKFWTIYTLFAALACITIIKDGAVDYYFNELAYVLSIQVGLALAIATQSTAFEGLPESVKRNKENGQSGAVFPARFLQFLKLGVVIQILIAAGMLFAWGQGRDFDNFRQPYNQAVKMVQEAQNRPILVFADNLLLATNHTELIGDYFIYSILVENKKRDPEPLKNDLEKGYYDFVISEEFFRWPQIFEKALNDRYNLTYLTGEDGRHLFRVYIRKP